MPSVIIGGETTAPLGEMALAARRQALSELDTLARLGLLNPGGGSYGGSGRIGGRLGGAGGGSVEDFNGFGSIRRRATPLPLPTGMSDTLQFLGDNAPDYRNSSALYQAAAQNLPGQLAGSDRFNYLTGMAQNNRKYADQRDDISRRFSNEENQMAFNQDLQGRQFAENERRNKALEEDRDAARGEKAKADMFRQYSIAQQLADRMHGTNMQVLATKLKQAQDAGMDEDAANFQAQIMQAQQDHDVRTQQLLQRFGQLPVQGGDTGESRSMGIPGATELAPMQGPDDSEMTIGPRANAGVSAQAPAGGFEQRLAQARKAKADEKIKAKSDQQANDIAKGRWADEINDVQSLAARAVDPADAAVLMGYAKSLNNQVITGVQAGRLGTMPDTPEEVQAAMNNVKQYYQDRFNTEKEARADQKVQREMASDIKLASASPEEWTKYVDSKIKSGDIPATAREVMLQKNPTINAIETHKTNFSRLQPAEVLARATSALADLSNPETVKNIQNQNRGLRVDVLKDFMGDQIKQAREDINKQRLDAAVQSRLTGNPGSYQAAARFTPDILNPSQQASVAQMEIMNGLMRDKTKDMPGNPWEGPTYNRNKASIDAATTRMGLLKRFFGL